MTREEALVLPSSSTTIPMSESQHNEEDLTPERLAQLAASYAADKKAIDLQVIDLRGVSSYTDFFVVCSGNTDRQTKAIHDAVHEGLKKDHGLLPRRVEGLSEARWVLMDYFDVVVHVFTPETRDFYRLESLWGDVPRRDLDPVELLAELPEAERVAG